MRTVVFTKSFATKKKGDEFTCTGTLANFLVTKDKVAKYIDKKKA